MSRKAVLVTGSAGKIGTTLMEDLAGRYDLAGVDLRETPGPGRHRGDLADDGVMDEALSGREVVVHLAAEPSRARFDAGYFTAQTTMAKKLFEAARKFGVKRVVFASSNQVTGWYEKIAPYAAIISGNYGSLAPSDVPLITVKLPPHPCTSYAVSKVWGESLGRHYTAEHGLSVICLRIGTFKEESRPTHVRQFSTLLTRADLVQLVSRCIDAPEKVRYDIFYGISDNTWKIWDISDARRIVGYHPRDDAENWR